MVVGSRGTRRHARGYITAGGAAKQKRFGLAQSILASEPDMVTETGKEPRHAINKRGNG